MKHAIALSSVIVTGLLSACGGGDGSSATTPATSTPSVGTKVLFAVTDTDNANNTIPWQQADTVLTVAPDGSYTQSDVGNGGSITVNGARYGTLNQVVAFDAAQHETSYVVEGTTPVTCTFAAPFAYKPAHAAAGSPWPVFNDTIACSNGDNYAVTVQDGELVDVEDLTVPAGMFSANKVQYTITSTNTATHAATITHTTVWYDAATGDRLQSIIDYSYANMTFTNGYRTHEVQQRLTPI